MSKLVFLFLGFLAEYQYLSHIRSQPRRAKSNARTKIAEKVEIPVLTRCCLCVPLRIGLVAYAYLNLLLTLVVTGLLSYYISYLRHIHSQISESDSTDSSGTSDVSEYPRLVADVGALVLETLMTIIFIYALHKKHVFLMRVYLYFEIIFSVLGFLYSLAFLTRETASELFLILFQMTLQIYLAILIRSSIIKMERDGSVKYTRENDLAV